MSGQLHHRHLHVSGGLENSDGSVSVLERSSLTERRSDGAIPALVVLCSDSPSSIIVLKALCAYIRCPLIQTYAVIFRVI